MKKSSELIILFIFLLIIVIFGILMFIPGLKKEIITRFNNLAPLNSEASLGDSFSNCGPGGTPGYGTVAFYSADYDSSTGNGSRLGECYINNGHLEGCDQPCNNYIYSSGGGGIISKAEIFGMDWSNRCSTSYRCTIEDSFIETPPPVYYCFANDKSLYNATKAIWATDGTTAANHKITKFPGTSVSMTEELCVPLSDPAYCVPEAVNPKNKEVSAKLCCEDNIELSYEDGKKCNEKSFYDITCENKINIKYDNGDDYDRGGITIDVNKSCIAKFNKSNWSKAYDKLNEKKSIVKKAKKNASKEDKIKLDKKINEIDHIINDLKQVAIDYNNEVKSLGFIPEATIELKYKDVNNKNKIEKELVVNNYHWDNYDKPKVIKLILPKSYIDDNTGEVTDDKNKIDGGNKLYIDYSAKSSEKGEDSTMKITLVGKSYNIEVDKFENIKCHALERDVNIKYRPIALTNPFINSDYKKGDNWVNEKYDFTKIINSNVWSRKALYDITLTSLQIEDLKYSNIKNQSSSPYLGLCDKIKSSMQDDITQTICNALK